MKAQDRSQESEVRSQKVYLKRLLKTEKPDPQLASGSCLLNSVRAGFTLIEMLTVLVIVGIMLGIGLPAVTNFMKSGALGAATRHVSDTLSWARQYAITQRMYARVVFPFAATGSQTDMWYRTYAVMTNRDNTATANWRYASKWEYLPVGVVFLNSTPVGVAPLPAGAGALDDNVKSLNQQGSLPFPDSATINPNPLAYIEFSPTGVATPVSSSVGSITLAITEGFMTSGLSPTPTPTSKTSVGVLVNVATISVDSLVGRIKVTRP